MSPGAGQGMVRAGRDGHEMARTTPATLALQRLGIGFELVSYAYEPGAERIGLQAAAAIGEDPARVLKTLIAQVDGQPVCLVLPSDCEASLKKVAAAFGGKAAAMMPGPDAESMTGYKIGGISPLGQKRRLPVLVEQAALAHPLVYVNGGQRGLQLRLAPEDLLRAIEGRAAAIIA